MKIKLIVKQTDSDNNTTQFSLEQGIYTITDLQELLHKITFLTGFTYIAKVETINYRSLTTTDEDEGPDMYQAQGLGDRW